MKKPKAKRVPRIKSNTILGQSYFKTSNRKVEIIGFVLGLFVASLIFYILRSL